MRLFATLGRLLVSINFIALGLLNIYYFELARSDLARAFVSLESHIAQFPELIEVISYLHANISIVLMAMISLQIFGGILVFFNYFLRLGVFLLLVYLIPYSVVVDHFWYLSGSELSHSFMRFLLDLSTMGALFLIISVSRGIDYKAMGKAKEN